MKSVAIAVASLVTVIAPAANAAYDRYGNYYEPNDSRSYEYRERDRAVDSRPVYTTDTREECWNTRNGRFENRPEANNRVGAGTAIGAVAGGVVGHQVGSGRGNDAATVGGAVVGGAVGANVGRSGGATSSRDVQRCATAPSQPGADYWDVTYSFRGQEHRVQMSAPPGRTVSVNAQGEPRA
jgi:uncharacterized protein YcfJ